MTSKTLTGTYTAGYGLHTPFTTVTVATSGYVGGTGIATSATAHVAYTLVNLGKISESTTPYNGNGVFLADGGSLTNGSATLTSASISGYRGVKMEQAVGTVINFGQITATQRSGVFLAAGGSITNGALSDKNATISTASLYSSGISCGDYDGVTGKHTGVGGTVTNFGTVTGNGGVLLEAGGRVTNGAASDTSALIRGAGTGLFVYSYTGAETATVTNFGTIASGGASGYGVQLGSLGAGSRLVNGASAGAAALITGNIGVYVGGTGEAVFNFGTIQGTGGVAVYFAQAADTLILEAGSTVLGGVAAAATDTIEAAAGVATIKGDLANAGAIVGTGSLVVAGAISTFAPGSTVTRTHVTLGGEALLSGNLTINAGALTARSLAVGANDVVTVTGAQSGLSVTGAVKVAAGGLIDAVTGSRVQIGGSVANAGTIEVTGGTMDLTGLLSGAGSAQIRSGVLQLAGPAIGAVAFTGTTGVLQLGLSIVTPYSIVTFTGAVSGLSTTGVSSLDLLEVPYIGTGTTVSYVDNGKRTGGVLTVSGNIAGQGQSDEITLVGDYVGGTWSLVSDAKGGTKVSYSTPHASSSPRGFADAMAGFAAPACTPHVATESPLAAQRLITAPRAIA